MWKTRSQIDSTTSLAQYYPAARMILVIVALSTYGLAVHPCVPAGFFYLGLNYSHWLPWLAMLCHLGACLLCFLERPDRSFPLFPSNKKGRQFAITLPALPALPGELKELAVAILELLALTILVYTTGGVDSLFAPFYPAFPVVFGMVARSRRVAMGTFIGTCLSFAITLHRSIPVLDLQAGMSGHSTHYQWYVLGVFVATLFVTAQQVYSEFSDDDQATKSLPPGEETLTPNN